MRILILTLALAGGCAGTAQAQVINGESTDDSAYAPRPPARWSPPDGQPDGFGPPRDELADELAKTEKKERPSPRE